MIRKLQDYLEEHKIKYTVNYCGESNDVINIEIEQYTIIADNNDQYMVCNVETANFRWVTFSELTEMLS